MSVYLSSDDARGVLGVRSPISANRILQDHGVINQSRSGIANSYLSDDVVRVLFQRQTEALARHRNDPVTFAREIRSVLHPAPPATVTTSDGKRIALDSEAVAFSMKQPRGEAALVMLPPDAAMVFGLGVLKAAAADLKPGLCRYCLAHIETPHGGIGPDLSEACTVLLGQPCLRCKVDLTPPKPVKRQAAVRASGGRPVTRSARKAAEWRQTAAQHRAAGDPAGAAVAERNAGHWIQYGREHPGS
jgi:hypothetical protein